MLRGSATSDGRQFAYFAPRGSAFVFSYEWCKEEWRRLPLCPNKNPGLVTVNGNLVAVGGGHFSNKLYTLREGRWVEEYPPVSTGRESPAVVSTSDGHFIICIGGNVGVSVPTAAVELLDTRNNKWYKLLDLPEPLRYPSATVCGDNLHVIGIGGVGYSCSIKTLFSDSMQLPLLVSWTCHPYPPVTLAVAATLSQELVLVGGDQVGTVPWILQLANGEWTKIGAMSTRRKSCLVVNLSPDHILIVGGLGGEDSIEECIVV